MYQKLTDGSRFLLSIYDGIFNMIFHSTSGGGGGRGGGVGGRCLIMSLLHSEAEPMGWLVGAQPPPTGPTTSARD
ncbi:hypothetical protein Tco_1306728 [Tanacetum coccineum]